MKWDDAWVKMSGERRMWNNNNDDENGNGKGWKLNKRKQERIDVDGLSGAGEGKTQVFGCFFLNLK